MSSARIKQTFRLRLLALILALAILWYCVNPAPRSAVHSLKREDDQPDEKRDAAAALPEISRATLSLRLYSPQRFERSDALPPIIEEDDFEWPEFIDG